MNTQRGHFLLAVFLASLALTHADLYGTPSPPTGPAPPPPFAIKGVIFPPDSTICIDPTTSCFNKTIQCPAECPMARPASPTAKACFMDCKKCEASCKHRKPNCEGNGAACFDPRFVGGDGIMFYFHGKAGHHFTLVSDAGLQINARFIGLRPPGRPRDFTWIQALGIMFGSHAFTVSARPGLSPWDADQDHFHFAYDGAPVDVPEGHRSSWSAADDSGLEVERTARANSVAVALPGVFEIMTSVVPVTEEDNRVHGYQIPAGGDCFAHLEVQFRFLGLSEKVEGVLGQTYRPDFRNPVKRGVLMPVMGGEDRYVTSSLLSSDCKYCLFSPAAVAGGAIELGLDDASKAASAATLDCTSKMGNGYGVVCRR